MQLVRFNRSPYILVLGRKSKTHLDANQLPKEDEIPTAVL